MRRAAQLCACWLVAALALAADGPMAASTPAALPTSANAGATVEVRLRPTVVLAAPCATLADLADLTGPPDAVAAVAGLAIQELTSAVVRVDERVVRGRIGRQANAITLRISGTAMVRQPMRVVSVAEQQAVGAALLNAKGDAEVTLVRASGQFAFGDDGKAQQLVAEPLDRGTVGEVPLRVKALRGDRELARGLVVLRIRRFAQVVMLEADVHHGQAIGAGDVGLQRVELTSATQEAFHSLDEAVGRVVIRDLAAGQVLTPGLAQPPADVRAGQSVTMVFRGGAVELTAPGEALSAGHAGEIIMVRRLADEQRVRTQVLGPGRVLVNF